MPLLDLDTAATTPVDPDVIDDMIEVLRRVPGNPSSTHPPGRDAARRVEVARAAVAEQLGCDPDEIIVTAGATDSTNHRHFSPWGRVTPRWRTSRAGRVTAICLCLPVASRPTILPSSISLRAFKDEDRHPTIRLCENLSVAVRPSLSFTAADRACRNCDAKAGQWLRYWRVNPVNAWTGGNCSGLSRAWFEVREGRFCPTFDVAGEDLDTFQSMVRELVDYRFAAYERRLTKTSTGEEGPERAEVQSTESARVLPFSRPTASIPARIELPYYPDIRIACGHFRRGRGDSEQRCAVDAQGYGRLDPARDFVARAVGHSMDGGSRPIHDGDYLLLERIAPTQTGTLNGQIVAIERHDAAEDQYLLRRVIKTADGRYRLKANHPDYPEIEADEEMRPLARLGAVVDPVDILDLASLS